MLSLVLGAGCRDERLLCNTNHFKKIAIRANRQSSCWSIRFRVCKWKLVDLVKIGLSFARQIPKSARKKETHIAPVWLIPIFTSCRCKTGLERWNTLVSISIASVVKASNIGWAMLALLANSEISGRRLEDNLVQLHTSWLSRASHACIFCGVRTNFLNHTMLATWLQIGVNRHRPAKE